MYCTCTLGGRSRYTVLERISFCVNFLRDLLDRTASTKYIDNRRMLFWDASWQCGRTPLSVDTGRCRWSKAMELLVTLVLNLLIMTRAADVRAVLKLARYADQ